MQPEKIGRYEIKALLGKGAMGTVYKAFDPLLHRHAAIKVMNLDGEGDEELRSRFYREARSAAKLQHPNIISIFDLGEDEGQPYIAMEYLEGQDLKTIIRKRLFVPFKRKLQAVAEICDGLHYAHRRGIVHRDVKPGNIFLTHQNEVKVLDFGLARIDSSEITRSGQVMGSPYYMSPEQVTGKSDLDGRSDIFSLGVLFYEWISFLKPFEGESPTSICYQIVSDAHPPLSEVSPHCAPQLAEIIDRSLSKDRSQRFQSCADFAAALRGILPQLDDSARQLRQHLEALAADLKKQRAEFDQPAIRHLADDALFELPPLPKAEKNELGYQFDPGDYGSMLTRSSQARRQMEEIAERREQARKLLEGVAQARKMLEEGQLDACQELLAGLLKGSADNQHLLSLQKELKEAYRQQQLRLRLDTALAVASRALEDRDFQRCLKAAASALKIDSSNAEALDLRRQASEGQKQQKVERHLSAALKQEKSGDLEDCLQSVSEGLQLDPENRQLAEIQQRVGEALEKQRALAQKLETARRQLEQDRFEQALSSVGEALQIAPDDSQALELKQSINKAQRNHRKAVKLLAQARASEEQGELQESHQAASQALKLGLKDAELQQLLERVGAKLEEEGKISSLLEQAHRKIERRDFEAALSTIEEALALDPEHSQALEMKRSASKAWRRAKLEDLLARGRERKEAGDYQKWYQLTAEALQLEPDLPEIKQMYEDASRHLQVQKEHQNRIDELLRFARSEMKRGDFRSALENLSFLLELEPDNAPALRLRKRAEAALETGSEPLPPDAEADVPPPPPPEAGVVADPDQPPDFVPPETLPLPPPATGAEPGLGERAREAFSGLAAKMAEHRTAVLAGGGTLLLLLIIVAAASLWPESQPTPPPPAPLPGTLVLNVSPWAEVESIIRASDNQPVELPAGDLSTPYRQQLPAGAYRVRVRHPMLTEPYEFEVNVAGSQATSIHRELPGFDRQKAIGAALGIEQDAGEDAEGKPGDEQGRSRPPE